MLGRKKRFGLANICFAVFALALIGVFMFIVDPMFGGTGVLSMAGLALMPVIDTKDMSEQEKKGWENLDKALNEVFLKAIKEEVNIDGFKKAVIDELKTMDEFKKVDIAEFVNQKKFDETIQEVKDAIISMKSAFEKSSTGKVTLKTLDEQIEDQLKQFITIEKGIKTIDLKEACKQSPGHKKTIEIVLSTKAAPVMSGGVATTVFGNVIDPVLSVDPRSLTIIRQYANVSTILGRSLTYPEFVPEVGDAEWVPEGGLKPSMKSTLAEHTVTVAKVALTTKLTEETLTDLPQLVSEIRTELLYRIGLEEENGILNGDGTNGNIKGLLSEIPGFALTGYSVEKANKYDALVAAYTQVISTSNMAYRPNLVMMNPIDYALMQSEKDLNGQYLRPFRAGDELIQGLQVTTSTAVEQGEYFMGDFNYFNIRDRVALSVTFGWENDDFTKNMVTMIGEKRLLTYIKKQYITAFVYDTFANTIAAIQ